MRPNMKDHVHYEKESVNLHDKNSGKVFHC